MIQYMHIIYNNRKVRLTRSLEHTKQTKLGARKGTLVEHDIVSVVF